MSVQIPLRADCSKCCGLCCSAPAFYADQGFGVDKPAHTACANLKADYRCAIYEQRAQRGFGACAGFDCHGAGQWVTQQLCGGRSWRSSPELAAWMFTAYLRYRALHELMALLDLAIRTLPPAGIAPLEACLRDLEEVCRSGPEVAQGANLPALRRRVRGLLRDGVAVQSQRSGMLTPS